VHPKYAKKQNKTKQNKTKKQTKKKEIETQKACDKNNNVTHKKKQFTNIGIRLIISWPTNG